MAKKSSCSRVSIVSSPENDFSDQAILSYDEVCSFNDEDMESLKAIGAFPFDVVFWPFEATVEPDFGSPTWVCFIEYPFTLGVTYPFNCIVRDLFSTTKISYIQAMPMVWRIAFLFLLMFAFLSGLHSCFSVHIWCQDLCWESWVHSIRSGENMEDHQWGSFPGVELLKKQKAKK